MTSRPRPIPRKAPSQERSRATVAAILDATARILVEDGYEQASTNRIAQAAGVSVGSLYQYFPNKEALVAAVVERHCDALLQRMSTKMVELAEAPLPVMTQRMVELIFEAHAQEPRLHRALMEQVPRTGPDSKLREIAGRMTCLVAAYLAQHREELGPEDPELAAYFVVHLVEGVAQAHLFAPPKHALGTLTAGLTRMILAYVAGERASTRRPRT